MAIRKMKPTTPGQRGMTSQDFSEITTKKPIKSLLKPMKRSSGRNHRGVITSRRRGGGAKRHYRLVSFKLPENFEAQVKEIEYDPNRSTRLARLKTSEGSYHYILAPKNLRQGQTVKAGSSADIENGHRLPLSKIPIGSLIHNLELRPGRGGQIVRSAGLSAQITAKDDKYAQVKLPSGEIRLFRLEAQASLGVLGNEQHKNIKLGKAGRNRHKGRRPKVRGVATNPSDHPHGGGEGKRKGYKTPVTPWGQPTLGYKTRPRRKSNRLIVRSRHLNKRK
ncbi:MAG: 50S ribosomal protein L2 [Candidatus Saccharibacteria bacterium]|nr:50S ribosomal protein L2 [Candidatus Saccharibacteria bacterium]MCY4010950.1 50S ribosomal protein L2 [Candidatus Saccharibacteria bacterium]MCY4089047.1 50S ribosomal protein L2 [Candidatus Saccharibacteria bacterium]